MLLDLHGALQAATLCSPATHSSTTTGAGINISKHIGVIKVLQIVGAVSGTGPTLDGKIQDSADDSSYADLATFAQVTASTNLQSVAVDTRKARKFIRYVGTVGGVAPSFALATVAVTDRQYR